MVGATSDYANLPRDILQELSKFLSFSDYIRFSVVCLHWFEVAKERCHFPQKQPYSLIFDADFQRLFDLSEEKIYQIQMPELCERHCLGSSYGWLITADLNLNINLFNPFSKAQVKLPQLPYHVYEIRKKNQLHLLIYKAVISADPSKSSNYIVAAHFIPSKLIFWRSSDLTWTVIRIDFFFQDIIWYNGAFYTVGTNRQVYRVEFGMKNELIKIASESNVYWHKKNTYMVNFMGDLLLIYRIFYPINYNEGNNDTDDAVDLDQDNDNNGLRNYYHNDANTRNLFHTRRFMLFKLDQRKNQFIEIKSINGHVLFMGENYAVLIPITIRSDKTEDNVIYFSDAHINANGMYRFSNSRVYSIRDESITPIPLNNIYRHVYHQAKQPMFVDADLSSLILV
ncbi:F-box domain-containing protein [Dioscorea alata]|uniref:F-box domain-containing protein n=1 Tax=Dioscorea alata TaxID=55571 RepID=A0ACB7UDU4_DIOAL|nr:F-box domain-containing protein [Dioscorea alata]